ncbi:MAG TPA: hypothetical protein PK867_21095 [Pirellulales bacterium]|nr:hypothetical protein [Pirellulales bacterium]
MVPASLCDLDRRGYTAPMPSKPQFTLRWIFVLTAAVAALCGQAFAFPDWLAEIVWIMVTLSLPSVFVAGIVYARGAGQAFSIGALVWFASGCIAIVTLDLGSIQIFDGGRVDLCVFWLLPCCGGLAAVVVRWLTRRE